MCLPLAIAWKPGTACSDSRPTCRWGQPPTSKAESRERMPWEASASLPGRWVRRWSKSLNRSLRVQACVSTKPARQASIPSPSKAPTSITKSTIRARSGEFSNGTTQASHADHIQAQSAHQQHQRDEPPPVYPPYASMCLDDDVEWQQGEQHDGGKCAAHGEEHSSHGTHPKKEPEPGRSIHEAEYRHLE